MKKIVGKVSKNKAKSLINKWSQVLSHPYHFSGSGQTSYGPIGIEKKREITPPKEKYCDNKDCQGPYINPNAESHPREFKYCPRCGNELSERLVDLKIDLVFPNKQSYLEHNGGWELEDFSVTLDPSSDSNKEVQKKPKEYKIRIGMKEFVSLIEAYKKEVFIDKI